MSDEVYYHDHGDGDPKSTGAKAYENLAKELLARDGNN